eukprot:TRINITY_DN1185_c0_g1_i1.p1 TRINITY_DN1185_c0_g1~~TRINITY_DN1185_c0_g1_i1.p1  ORF type:complete len:219 (-),score=18.07 TRINITY_DN1185_c0_g1_i1:15-644(-)
MGNSNSHPFPRPPKDKKRRSKVFRIPISEPRWVSGTRHSRKTTQDEAPKWIKDGPNPIMVPETLLVPPSDGSSPIHALPREICNQILGYLSLSDLISVQATSMYWNIVGDDASTWRAILNEKPWFPDAKDLGKPSRKFFAEHNKKRTCTRCKKTYQQSDNIKTPKCAEHSAGRDLMDRPWHGTGVYWTCCYQKELDAPGCKATHVHKDE